MTRSHFGTILSIGGLAALLVAVILAARHPAIITLLVVGTGAFFLGHWFAGKVYCPRCSHYLDWRETILREIVPSWTKRPRPPDPWER